MSLMSAIRRMLRGRRDAVGDFTLFSGAPDSYLAFGGRPPRMPTEPARVESTNSITGPRPVDPGEVFHVKSRPKAERPPPEG